MKPYSPTSIRLYFARLKKPFWCRLNADLPRWYVSDVKNAKYEAAVTITNIFHRSFNRVIEASFKRRGTFLSWIRSVSTRSYSVKYYMLSIIIVTDGAGLWSN